MEMNSIQELLSRALALQAYRTLWREKYVLESEGWPKNPKKLSIKIRSQPPAMKNRPLFHSRHRSQAAARQGAQGPAWGDHGGGKLEILYIPYIVVGISWKSYDAGYLWLTYIYILEIRYIRWC